ncbi:MAG: IclR family transcriptional regulator [Pseudomonadota bacterium]
MTTTPGAAARDEKDSKDQGSALGRGLSLLDCFRSSERFLSLQDLVDRSGLPKATASRLVQTLAASGYIAFAESQGKYYLGARVISLGFSALGSMRVRQVARPFMRELAESCSASVGIGARDRHTMLYVENAASTANQNFRLHTGSRVLLATSAMGRAYYCGLDEAERDTLLSEISARTPSDFAPLKASLEAGLKDYRERGFCLSVGEWQNDVNAVGVPYRSPDGTAVLGFNCCGPAFQLTREDLLEKWGPRLVNMVRNVEAAAFS